MSTDMPNLAKFRVLRRCAARKARRRGRSARGGREPASREAAATPAWPPVARLRSVRPSVPRSREVDRAQGGIKQRTVPPVRESGSKGRGPHRAQGGIKQRTVRSVRESGSKGRGRHRAQGEDKQRTVPSVRESGSKGRGRHRAQGRAASGTQGRMPNQGPRAPVKATVRHLPVMNLAFPEVTWPLLTAARVVNSPPPLAARRAPSPDPRRARALQRPPKAADTAALTLSCEQSSVWPTLMSARHPNPSLPSNARSYNTTDQISPILLALRR